MYVVYVFTANRGNKSRKINSSFDRFPEKDLLIMRNRIEELILQPETYMFIFGGAIGGDTVLLKNAVELRDGNRPILVVVVPVTLRFQSKETWDITLLADELIEMKQDTHDKFGDFRKIIYKNRNKGMFKRAQKENCKVKLEAFWDGKKMYSGTYSTIVTARKMDIPVNINKIGSSD